MPVPMPCLCRVPCRAAPLCLDSDATLLDRVHIYAGIPGGERAVWAWRTPRSCPPVHRNINSKPSSSLVILWWAETGSFFRCAGFAKDVIMGIFRKVPKSHNFEA